MDFLTIQNRFVEAITEVDGKLTATLSIEDGATLTGFTESELYFFDINNDGVVTY